MAEIMVDIDDCLMPWAEVIRDLAVELNVIPPGSTWSSWEQWTDWGISRGMWMAVVEVANNGGIYSKTAPYLDAVNVINRLMWEGHNIHVVTARQGPNIASLTPNWFHDHGIAYTTMTFAQDKVATQEKLGVEFDYAVDDGPHNYRALLLNGVRTYLMDQPHNQHIDTPLRVRSLTEFGRHIRLEETSRGTAA